MKNSWSLLLLAVILQSLTLSIVTGNHGHGSHLAHILAAGLIVQLLAKQNGHHHHHGRHSGRSSESGYSSYGPESWLGDSRMSPQATLSSSTWSQRVPLDMSYAHSSYKEPIMESYNIPYYNVPYSHHEQMSPGIW